MSPNVKKIKRDLTNSYTVRQTAQLLSLTPKRVRQMLTEGKLKRVSTNPILLDQREVLDLRNAREALKVEQQPAADNTAQLLDQFQKLMDSVQEQNNRTLAITNEVHTREKEQLIDQINRLTAELEAKRARRWYQR